MYVFIASPRICINSPFKEQIVHFSSNLLKGTEGSHKVALDFAADSVAYLTAHDFPYYISYNAISNIEKLMAYGDNLGTLLMSLYFALMQFLNTPC